MVGRFAVWQNPCIGATGQLIGVSSTAQGPKEMRHPVSQVAHIALDVVVVVVFQPPGGKVDRVIVPHQKFTSTSTFSMAASSFAAFASAAF